MVRLMLKCASVEKTLAQLKYMEQFLMIAQKLEGQKLSGKNNLGNYTVQIEKGSK